MRRIEACRKLFNTLQHAIASPLRMTFTLLLCLAIVGCGVSNYSREYQMATYAESPTSSVSNLPGWSSLALMPIPRDIDIGKGRYTLPAALPVILKGPDSPRLRRAIERWGQSAALETGRELKLQWADSTPPLLALTVAVVDAGEEYPQLETDESYQLEVSANGISLSATSHFGAVRGLQTLRQLLIVEGASLHLPEVHIVDSPEWRWRGITLDTARHFMPLPSVMRLLDGMAMVKLNVLHLHLSDDQGFRVESKTLPHLHQKASNGEYYSQADIKTLIEYAADRGIRVVPEFGLPGHSLSWQVAYPELVVPGQPEPQLGKWKDVFSPPIDPTRTETYQLIEQFTGEMAALFPDNYFHIGSDEVNPKPWEKSADIRAFMREYGLKSAADLHGYFARRYADIVRTHGKYPIGWEEALHPGHDSESPLTIQLWLKGKYPADLARHPIIMSRDYYLDHQQPAWWLYGRDVTGFSVEGIGNEQREQLDRQVLGAEVAVWSERVDGRTLDMEVWPRTAALAERYWTSPSRLVLGDLTDLYRRLDAVSARMEVAGIRHLQASRDHIQSLAGDGDMEALMTLAEVVEPAAYYYQRSTKRMLKFALGSVLPFVSTPPYSMGTMQRFVENLPSESVRAQHFSARVDRYLAGERELLNALREELQGWATNHQRLEPTIAASPLLHEDNLQRVSAGLSDIANVGLQALTALQERKAIGAVRGWWLAERLDDYQYGIFHFDNFGEIIRGMFRPDALQQHNIAIQPAVSRLLDAARSL